MATETELKLRLSRAEALRLGRQPLLATQAPGSVRLQNTYYDTADHALRRRGIALRLRRKGRGEWLITIKGGESGSGGLARRREWEAPTRPGVLDFTVVGDSDLQLFLEQQRPQLKPVFTTDFTRTLWRLPHAGALIEVALDRGEIKALATADGKAAASEALCELELELIDGATPDALFDLAITLAGELHLHPEIRSKAERGYLLARPELARPFKAAGSPLRRDQSPVEAFAAIALSCLEQLQRNEGGTIAGGEVEYVHQARVAIRRLRSALALFAPRLSPRFVAVYAPRWRALARRLGVARDWDVFLSETLAPIEEAFPGDADLARLRARSETNRDEAQAAAAAALASRDYSQLVLAFAAALLRSEAPTIAASGKGGATKLSRFASRRLDKRLKAIKRLAKARASIERRHQLRIACKKLRYAVEFFAPLLATKRLSRYLNSLSTIQDFLGALNDQATASRLLKKMQPKGSPQPLTRGWIAGRTQLLVETLDSELEAFLEARKPWR